MEKRIIEDIQYLIDEEIRKAETEIFSRLRIEIYNKINQAEKLMESKEARYIFSHSLGRSSQRLYEKRHDIYMVLQGYYNTLGIIRKIEDGILDFNKKNGRR